MKTHSSKTLPATAKGVELRKMFIHSGAVRCPSGRTSALCAAVMTLGLLACGGAYSQVASPGDQGQPISAPSASVIPEQIRYSGTVAERGGDTVEAVFRIYTAQQGGEALWSETQRVTIAPDGRYSVLLGSASEHGLPETVFADGQARWLGVSIERGEEQPRTLIASVAYAMKAADAETLAGRAAADFVTQQQLSAAAKSLAAQATALALPETTLTGSGAAGYLPLWTSSSALGDSIVYEEGTTKVGIATKTPATTLDVKGATTLRGTVSLPYSTPASSASSPMLELSAIAASVAQNFAWRATNASSSANLELLFSAGSASPAPTGLAISPKGVITFAKGQTFPGAGTITSVASGTGLTGGATSGPVTLSVDTTKVPLLAAANNFTGSDTFSKPILFSTSQTFPGTITSVTAGTALTESGSGGAITLNVDTTKVPLLSAGNTFAASQTFNAGLVSGGEIAVLSASSPGIGVLTTATGGEGISGENATTGGTGVFGRGPNGTGVSGTGTYGVIGNGGCCSGGITSGGTGISGSALIGVWGTTGGPDSATPVNGWGVLGNVPSSTASFSAEGTAVAGAHSAGVWGDTTGDGSAGVMATADDHSAVLAVNNTTDTNSATLKIYDYTTDTHDPLFETYSPNTYSNGRNCVIDTSANLECSGLVEGQVTSPDVDPTVHAMYAMQSPEVWFEDFGSGTLQNGSAHVSLEALFGGVVNAGVEYHVFLTPKGDCEGLYVTNEGPGGFDVRELRHGKSSVAFDYRIVAKRKGYETVRMEDQTAQFEARKASEEERARRMTEAAAHPAMASPRGTLRGQSAAPLDLVPKGQVSPY